MAGDEASDDLSWIGDYIVTVFKSPTWAGPIAEFVDEKCIFFDDMEESPLEHTRIHNDFKKLVGDLLVAHLAEVTVTEEQFTQFCDTGLGSHHQLHRALAEQLFAVEDFLTFKAMMVKQNADLCRDVITFEGDEEPPTPGLGVTGIISSVVRSSMDKGLQGAADEWQFYDSQLWSTAGSLLASRKGSTDEPDVDIVAAQVRCEEAELEQAIALSLQIEEERLRHIEAGAEPDAVVPQEPGVEDVLASALQPAETPSEEPLPAIQQLPGGAGFVSAPMCPLPPRVKQSSAAAPRMVQVEPLKVLGGPWGFVSAPLMQRPPVRQQEDVPPPPPPPPEEQAESTQEPVAEPESVPRLPGRAGFMSSPLMVVPPRPRVPVGRVASPEAAEAPVPPPEPPTLEVEDRPVSREVQGMRTNLQLWKGRAAKAMEPLSPKLKGQRSRVWSEQSAVPAPPAGPTDEERKLRAEHLRKQRDRLIQKRKEDRERQLAEFNWISGEDRSGAVPSTLDQVTQLSGEEKAAMGRRLIAELTPGAVVATETQPPPQDAESKADLMRRILTLQLRQGLMRSMASDAGVLDGQLNQLESMRWS